MNAGKWLILGMLTVALAAGIAAWVQRYYQTDAALAFWGKQALGLIAVAPEAVALRWDDGKPADRRLATAARGMLNVRYMLGSDFAYAWPADKTIAPALKRWGIEFRHGPEVFLIEFNADCTQATDAKSGKSIPLVPPAADSLRSFFEERFEAESTDGTRDGPRP